MRSLIYDYKDVFSLRDEIGICPNMKVEIYVTDNAPFFIRPFHAKEEDKAILDREMKRLCYLGILKERLFSLLKPGNANKQKGNPRQKGSDRLWAFEHEDS